VTVVPERFSSSNAAWVVTMRAKIGVTGPKSVDGPDLRDQHHPP